MSDEAVKRYRGQRGPNKVPRPKMTLISIRLPQEVVDHYEGSSVRMRDILIEHMRPSRTVDESAVQDTDLP